MPVMFETQHFITVNTKNKKDLISFVYLLNVRLPAIISACFPLRGRLQYKVQICQPADY
jgi:hypothetical protein